MTLNSRDATSPANLDGGSASGFGIAGKRFNNLLSYKYQNTKELLSVIANRDKIILKTMKNSSLIASEQQFHPKKHFQTPRSRTTVLEIPFWKSRSGNIVRQTSFVLHIADVAGSGWNLCKSENALLDNLDPK